MSLPSGIGGAITWQVGYFSAATPGFAAWLASGLGGGWSCRSSGFASIGDVVAALRPTPVLTSLLCAPVGSGGWTALLSNGPLGTDLGVLPSLAARELGCRGIRAMATGMEAKYPATVLEVYGPDGTGPLAVERSIAAANDGGRWVFETFGDPYPFEDLSAYTRRSKAARFTADLLRAYLRALGVPVDEEPVWAESWLITKAE